MPSDARIEMRSWIFVSLELARQDRRQEVRTKNRRFIEAREGFAISSKNFIEKYVSNVCSSYARFVQYRSYDGRSRRVKI